MMNNRTTQRKAGKAQQGTFSPHNGNPSFAAKAPSPDPAPPSPAVLSQARLSLQQSGSWLSDPNSEYMKNIREQTKAKLQSITGRMFQVLNDYEDSSAKDSSYMTDCISNLDAQLNTIENTQLKSNIQAMIAGYKEMCSDREELLYSLQDWFEEEHIDEVFQDIRSRHMSVNPKTQCLQQSLKDGKETSIKLRTLQDKMEDAAKRGANLNAYKEDKQKLEKELLKTKQTIDQLKSSQTSDRTNEQEIVAKTWKFAAKEICNMLQKVRDSGVSDLNQLEDKIQGMADSLATQALQIDQLLSDISTYEKVAHFSESMATKLSNDNTLLQEELENVRSELVQARKTIVGLEAKCGISVINKNETLGSIASALETKSINEIKEKGQDTPSLPVNDLQHELDELHDKMKALLIENEELKFDLNQLKQATVQCYTDESTQDVQDPSECLSSTEQHQLVSKNLSLTLQNKKLEESQHHIQQNEDLTTLHNLLSDKEALLASCEAEVQAQIEKATHFETSLNNLQVQFDQIKYENLVLKKELLMKDQEAQEISTPSLQLTSQIKDAEVSSEETHHTTVTGLQSKRQVKKPSTHSSGVSAGTLTMVSSECHPTAKSENTSELPRVISGSLIIKSQSTATSTEQMEETSNNLTISRNEDEMLKLVQYLVCQLNINKGCTDDNDTKDTDDNTMKNIRDDLHKLVTMIGSSKDMSLYSPSRGVEMNTYTVNNMKELVNQRCSGQNSQDEFSFVSEVSKFGDHVLPSQVTKKAISVTQYQKIRHSSPHKFPVQTDASSLTMEAHALAGHHSSLNHINKPQNNQQRRQSIFVNLADRKRMLQQYASTQLSNNSGDLSLVVSGVHQNDRHSNHSSFGSLGGIVGRGQRNTLRLQAKTTQKQDLKETYGHHVNRRRTHLFKPFHYDIKSRNQQPQWQVTSSSLGTSRSRPVLSRPWQNSIGRKNITGQEHNNGATFLDILKSNNGNSSGQTTKLPPIN